MAVNRIPREYGKSPNWQVEWTDSIRPHLGLRPNPYLPVQFMDVYNDDGFVVSAGQAVAVDTSGYLVPANGGVDTYVLYTAYDVDRTPNVNTGQLVTTADVTNGHAMKIEANAPIGFAPQHYYTNMIEGGQYNNYWRQDLVPTLCDWLIELPYVRDDYSGPYDMDANGELFNGCLLQVLPIAAASVGAATRSSNLGRLCLYKVDHDVTSGAPAALYGGVVGAYGLNCIEEQLIAQLDYIVSGFPKDYLDKVATVPGLGLDGSGTGGLPTHLNVVGNGLTAQATSTSVDVTNVRALRVNILK
jgi:hypothetical protein